MFEEAGLAFILGLAAFVDGILAAYRGVRREAILPLTLLTSACIAGLASGLSFGVLGALALLGASASMLASGVVRGASISAALGGLLVSLGGGAVSLDPRGNLLLSIALMLVMLGVGLGYVRPSLMYDTQGGGSALAEADAVIRVVALVVLVLGLAINGYWMLTGTEAPVPLGDPVYAAGFAGVAALLSPSPALSAMAYTVAAISTASILLGLPPYLQGGCSVCAVLVAVVLISGIVVLLRSWRPRLGRMELLALILAALPAALIPLGLADGSVYYRLLAGMVVAPLAAVALFYVARRATLPAVVLGVAALLLLAAAYTPASLQRLECSLEPVALGAPAAAPRPDPALLHEFYMLYLGAKNASIVYSLLEPKLGSEEALKFARFCYAISLAAEKRGIRDPYNITQLMHPDMLPTLEAVLSCNDVRVSVSLSPRIALCPSRLTLGEFNVSNVALPPFSRLESLEFTKASACRLARDYLILLADPNITDGDALRYALYASLLTSWGETRNPNKTAELIFYYAFNPNATLSRVSVSLVYKTRVVEAALFYTGLVVLLATTYFVRVSH